MKVELIYNSIRDSLILAYNVDFFVPHSINHVNNSFDIRPVFIDEGEGFTIRTRFRENITIFEFIVEAFGQEIFRTICNHMNKLERSQFQEYCKCVSAIQPENLAKILLRINGVEYLPEDILPEKWDRVELALKVYDLEWELNPYENVKKLEPLLLVFTGIVLSLFPLKNEIIVNQTEILDAFEVEGNLIKEETSRYERSPLNRNICLSLRGYACEICGFVFEDFYGDLGREFAIVHHIEPLSQMEAPRVINPKTDLAVVCANCHVMLHRKKPALSIEDLKKSISLQNQG